MATQDKSFNKGSVKNVFEHLHEQVREGCEKLFCNEHYNEAVIAATKSVTACLRKSTGLSADGVKLVAKAFDEKEHYLGFGNLSTESNRSKKEGLNLSLLGFYKLIRNVAVHGAEDIDKWEAFEYILTASSLCRKIEKAVISKDNDERALIAAVRADNVNAIENLLNRHKVDPNAKDAKDEEGTALMWAAYYGHCKVIRLLALAGADIDKKNKRGETALMWSNPGTQYRF